MSREPKIVPAVQMPSADLINFRFDQNDKNMAELKMMVANLSNNFATKEELHDLTKRLDNWQWYWRALITAALLALGTALAGLVIRS